MMNGTAVEASEEAIVLAGTVIFIILTSISVILNGSLPLLVLTDRSIKGRSYFYLANLSVVLLFLSLIFILDCVNYIVKEWIFGDAICKISGILAEGCIILSSLILLLISYDRYLLIFQSQLYSDKFNNVKKILLITAVISFILATPFGAIYRAYEDARGLRVCTNNRYGFKVAGLFFLTETIIVYLVPMAAMIFIYGKIYLLLRKRASGLIENQSFGIKFTSSYSPKTRKLEATVDEKSRIDLIPIEKSTDPKFSHSVVQAKGSSKSKNVNSLISMALIVGTFFLLWTPFMLVRFLKTMTTVPTTVVGISQLLFTLYLTIYPAIYILTNSKVRESSKKRILKWYKKHIK